LGSMNGRTVYINCRARKEEIYNVKGEV